MQPIAPLSSSAVDYLITFNARAVAIAPNGFVYTSNNPTGAAAAWWCTHADALRLAKAAHASGDIEGVAKRLHIHLTAHADVVERVRERTQRLDEALQRAQDEGLLAQFNHLYRRRRVAAQQSGQHYMTYRNAQRRLRKAITEVIANGGQLDKSVVSRALES